MIAALAGCSFHHGAGAGDGGGDDAPGDAIRDAMPLANACPPLATAPTAVMVSTVAALRSAIATASPGTTIELADGSYALDSGLAIATDGITLRSQSGHASEVVLDGGGTVSPIIGIAASGVTLTSLTIAHGGASAVDLEPTGTADLTDDTIYDVTFDDDVGPGVQIRPEDGDPTEGPFVDSGLIACSRFVDTTAVDHCTVPDQLAIHGIGVRGWTIRNNTFDHVTCPTTFKRTIWMRGGSRDTQLIDNHFLDSAMNIMLGDDLGLPARVYPDALPVECSDEDDNLPQHWGGVVCNNTIAGLDLPPISGEPETFEEGIALWSACDPWVLHNTIVTPSGTGTFHDIEFRYDDTFAHLVNNLVEQLPAARDSGVEDPAYAASDVVYAGATDFVDPHGGNLHLAATAPESSGASIQGLELCESDADGIARPLDAPTVGAYQR